jgi:hypothetical protein
VQEELPVLVKSMVTYSDPAAPWPPATAACRSLVAQECAPDAEVPDPDDGAAAAVGEDPAPVDGAAVLAAPVGLLAAEAGADPIELDELEELHPAASSAATASVAPVTGTRRERAVTFKEGSFLGKRRTP